LSYKSDNAALSRWLNGREPAALNAWKGDTIQARKERNRKKKAKQGHN